MPDPESFADLFADFFYKAILQAGGSKYTAHLCVAEWHRAVEDKELVGAAEEDRK